MNDVYWSLSVVYLIVGQPGGSRYTHGWNGKGKKEKKQADGQTGKGEVKNTLIYAQRKPQEMSNTGA